MAKKTKSADRYVPQHRWVALFIRFELPNESQLVEWCAQCGKLKLKRWESKGRAKSSERPQYYLPNADYERGAGSSHNTWGHREPPLCRPVQLSERR